jgi:hypothetical protein
MAANSQPPEWAGLVDLGVHHVPAGSVPMYVGGVDPFGKTHNWASVAALQGMTPQALILFNYGTTRAEVVNFYLRRNCGCKTLSPDGRNYSFLGATPGLIHVPAFSPVEAFDVLRLQELDLRALPGSPGKARMLARFVVRIRLSAKLVDPRLYEYRQMIRGGGFIHEGTWGPDGLWRLKHTSGPAPVVVAPELIPANAFQIPGLPEGLLPHTWKEDGLITAAGNLFYGHRGNPPAPPGTGRDEYSADGRSYLCEDFPGLEQLSAPQGLLVNLQISFKGVVVRFDKPPGAPGRKIVEQVAEKNWSFGASRRVRTSSPLRVVP